VTLGASASTNASVVPRSSARQRRRPSPIKPRAAAPTDPATISLPPARPGRHDALCLIADPHVLDDRPLQTQQARPYPDAAHVASAPLDSSPEEAGTLGAARRAPSINHSHHPREQQERPNSTLKLRDPLKQTANGKGCDSRESNPCVATLAGHW